MPYVSVIIPNYNHSLYLEQRLFSVVNQTFQDLEIIILDDCSTDNSREIIEKYRVHPKVSKIIYNDVNGGTSYKQWYKGIINAKGDLIWIAESDDWCDLRFLECIVPHFSEDDISLVFSKSVNVKADIDVKPIPVLTNTFTKYDGNKFIGKYMLIGNGIRNGSMVVFRREKYINLPSERWNKLIYAGDWLLWVEMANQSKIVELNDELNYFRVHEGSASNQFNKLGLFYIEGIQVVKRALSLAKDGYSKYKVLKFWTNHYFTNRKSMNKDVKLKILKEYAKFNVFFVLIYLYYFVRNQIKNIHS